MRRRRYLFLVVLLLLPTLAWAAPRYTEEILPMGAHLPGPSQSSTIPVLPTDRRVTMRLDRTNYTTVAALVRFTIEAQVDGQWREIKRTQQTKGGVIQGPSGPQLQSVAFVSMPAGATHVRGHVLAAGQPGTYRVWIEVE